MKYQPPPRGLKVERVPLEMSIQYPLLLCERPERAERLPDHPFSVFTDIHGQHAKTHTKETGDDELSGDDRDIMLRRTGAEEYSDC